VIFDPIDLIGKLAALVPPPRFNLVRYHGILAPAARWRSCIVPAVSTDTSSFMNCPICPVKNGKEYPHDENCQSASKVHPRNYSWAELLKRVFQLDVLKCSRCGGKMRILCAIHPPVAIQKILDCLGLPSKPPPISPAALEAFNYYETFRSCSRPEASWEGEVCKMLRFFVSSCSKMTSDLSLMIK
jgi:hypothetical protein